MFYSDISIHMTEFVNQEKDLKGNKSYKGPLLDKREVYDMPWAKYYIIFWYLIEILETF